MNERRVTHGQRDGDTGAHQGTFTGLKHHVRGGHQIGTRITRSGVGRNGNLGIKSGQ